MSEPVLRPEREPAGPDRLVKRDRQHELPMHRPDAEPVAIERLGERGIGRIIGQCDTCERSLGIGVDGEYTLAQLPEETESQT